MFEAERNLVKMYNRVTRLKDKSSYKRDGEICPELENAIYAIDDFLMWKAERDAEKARTTSGTTRGRGGGHPADYTKERF
jgi:hypothetical protein